MQWTVGRVKITKIVEVESIGGTRFILPQASTEEILKMPWLVPDFANEQGRLKMTIHSLIVETPEHRIMVDTGLGNDKQGRSVPAWNGLNTPYLTQIAEAGYPADSIDLVLCTHLHVDHVGWNTRLVAGRWVPTFDNARYLFGRTEYDHWAAHQDDPAHPPVSFRDSVQPIVDTGRADLIGSDYRVCDELTLIPTPGHSPGHLSILVHSQGEEMLLAGDAAHHPVQMMHLDWSSTADHDPAEAARTRRALFERFADTPTRVIGGHFSAGRVVRDGDAFRMKV
ncbi:MBL fold metallo-hydrolase [Bradyrhizobium prioriisuperbiae]|uniref:MBL fold metallo-hydrolase n=1 Tax=Bradyrhizobium prioriisuperbiae TaxID=2854389 RepID=UPI0028E1CB22|nr:MBL fold metallo-hydrolase [Bradyrhizobium prioritasuperba]